MRTFVAIAPPTAARATAAAAPGETPRTAARAGSIRTVRCGAAFSAPVCTLTVPGIERMYAASFSAPASITSPGPESVNEIGRPLPPPPRPVTVTSPPFTSGGSIVRSFAMTSS